MMNVTKLTFQNSCRKLQRITLSWGIQDRFHGRDDILSETLGYTGVCQMEKGR